jgi:hypothetical protein
MEVQSTKCPLRARVGTEIYVFAVENGLKQSLSPLVLLSGKPVEGKANALVLSPTP